MSSELREAIENLYSVFARYPLNPHMDGSPLYDELPAWNRTLSTKPLRNLSEDDLRIFSFKVMTTWGNVDDFRHFLPRIFELLTLLDTGWEEWVALDKLHYAQWHTWPANEQDAVRTYLLTFWCELLSSDSELVDAFFGDYFAAIANVYPDFDQLLHYWAKSESSYAIERLVNFVDWNSEMILRKQRLSVFDKSEEKGVLFVGWLTSPSMLNKLTNDFFQHPTANYAARLSSVIQMLEAAKTT